jgi:hypothetical protein
MHPGPDSTTYEFTYFYVQRQRCSRQERFFKEEENIFDFKTHLATSGVVTFYNAGPRS